MTTVSDPRRWHDVCEALVSLSRADYALLYPADERTGIFYSAGWIAADNPELHASQCRGADAESATTLLLDFGLDGIWLLRVGCHENSASRNAWNPKGLKAWESALKTAAKMSGKSFKAALRTRKNVHGQLNVPFACLDLEGRLLSCNALFEQMYARVFHLSGDILLPSQPSAAKVFRHLLNTVSVKNPVQNMPLCNTAGPCVATLRQLPESRVRVSRGGAVGLTLHGVAKPAMPQPTSLSWLFGLSRREAEITAQLATGKTVTVVATLHRVSVATVRAQVKSIFRKLKVNSQPELVVKILGSGI